MHNKLLITLTTLTLTACTSNLHALTKTRALTQTITTAAQSVASYARNNKLKTAGMMIGGALVLDVLQAEYRRIYHLPKLRAPYLPKLKDARQLIKTARASSNEAYEKHAVLLRKAFNNNPPETAAEKEEREAANAAWRATEKRVEEAEDARNKLSRDLPRIRAPFLYQVYWIITHKIKKIRDS